MNLNSQLRAHLYREKDIEVDIDKAHLSSYVPVAERFGFEVPTLRKALKASLKGEIDLWESLASRFDEDLMPDRQACITAAKPIYSAAYGSSKNNTRYEIIKKYADCTDQWVTGEAVNPIFDHPLMEEIYSVREKIRNRIINQGGIEDAFGRFIPLSKWEGKKEKENRWRGALAYVNASYELSLIWECFQEAIEELRWAEKKESRRPRFRIWLLQGDGFTVNVDRKRKPEAIVERLKECVTEKAEELGMPTGLSVERHGPPS
jgi:hypothetical protein